MDAAVRRAPSVRPHRDHTAAPDAAGERMDEDAKRKSQAKAEVILTCE
eukprot:gene25754-50580_t